MRYEVPKANSEVLDIDTPTGSIEAIDPFSAPVPGQSLTVEPGSQKYEKPADISNPDDAIMFVIEKLEQDKDLKEVHLSQMASGVPIEYIVNTISFTGFSEGMWTPDVAELIKPALAMYFIMQGMAEDVPMVVFNPKETDRGRLPSEEIARNMSKLNPEGYEIMKAGIERDDAEKERIEGGFLEEGEQIDFKKLPTEELATEELATEIPNERGML